MLDLFLLLFEFHVSQLVLLRYQLLLQILKGGGQGQGQVRSGSRESQVRVKVKYRLGSGLRSGGRQGVRGSTAGIRGRTQGNRQTHGIILSKKWSLTCRDVWCCLLAIRFSSSRRDIHSTSFFSFCSRSLKHIMNHSHLTAQNLRQTASND